MNLVRVWGNLCMDIKRNGDIVRQDEEIYIYRFTNFSSCSNIVVGTNIGGRSIAICLYLISGYN